MDDRAVSYLDLERSLILIAYAENSLQVLAIVIHFIFLH
jgi:hypothetical protein